MTAPTLHALFDGSDHGLIAGSALDRARHEVELIRAEFAEHEWTRAERAVVDLLAEHEALLRRVETLRDAGSALANIAYNLAQYDEVPAPEREILDAARRRWDVAMKGEGQRVRILAEPGEVG